MEDIDAVLSVVQRIQEVSERPPGKKTLQKLIYLIEEAGNPFGFKYGIHFYGPYSADLDYTIKYLNSYNQLFIEITPTEHRISVICNIEELPKLSEIADRIIVRYGHKSPSELELLATALYVQRAIDSSDNSKIIYGVQRIKGCKYSEDIIVSAVMELRSDSFF